MHLKLHLISQKFALYDHPAQMEPLLPSVLRMKQVSVGVHTAPVAAQLPQFLQR